MIIGPAPGGAADAITRVIASGLSDFWNQQVVVDNRPGAGNTIAAAIVAKATPDGYTLHRCGISDAIAPALYKKLSYDYLKDFAAIARIGVTPNIFVVHPNVPAKSVTEFIAYAKANPGKLDYAATGIGTSPQLSFELLKLMTGINVLYVPYKSAAMAMTDLLGGRVAAQITNMPTHVDTVRTGKVRALGVTSAKRSPRMPEVPTIAEAGVPGFEVTVWYAMCSPAAVDKSIQKKITTDLLKLLAAPDLRQRMADLGVEAEPLDAEQFTAFFKSETVKWAKVVKEAGIPQQ
jgi:tripartite-type tricarboxylate transporter receptor subunit TctC